ncbi:hypothetical protein LissoIVSPER_00042 [Lissonota sp. PSUC_FEM 10030012]|nr:hypothetical protein [Lissonota sp. PSUC_FEM 10030012]
MTNNSCSIKSQVGVTSDIRDSVIWFANIIRCSNDVLKYQGTANDEIVLRNLNKLNNSSLQN